MKRSIAMLIAALAVAVVVLSVLAVNYYKRANALDAKLKETAVQQKLDALANDLKAPTEALELDYDAALEIAEVRSRAYQRLGVKWLSYGMVLALEMIPPERLPLLKHEATDMENLMVASIEGDWRLRCRDAAQRIIGSFVHNGWLAQYLTKHPDVYWTRLQPYLVRLTNAQWQLLALDACAARIAAGERSDDIRQRLESLALASVRSGNHLSEGRVKELMAKAGWNYTSPQQTPFIVSGAGTDPLELVGHPLPTFALTRLGSLGRPADEAQPPATSSVHVIAVSQAKEGNPLAFDTGGRAWDLVTGKMAYRFGNDGVQFIQAAASANGSVFATLCDQPQEVHIRKVADGSLVQTLAYADHRSKSAPEFKFSPDGKTLAAGRWLWYLETGRMVERTHDLESPPIFAPDNRTMLTFTEVGQRRGHAQAWEFRPREGRLDSAGRRERKYLRNWLEKTTRPGRLVTSGDGLILVNLAHVGFEHQAQFYQISDAKLLRTAIVRPELLNAALSQKGRYIAALIGYPRPSYVAVYDSETGGELVRLPVFETPGSPRPFFLKDGRLLVAEKSQAVLWDLPAALEAAKKWRQGGAEMVQSAADRK